MLTNIYLTFVKFQLIVRVQPVSLKCLQPRDLQFYNLAEPYCPKQLNLVRQLFATCSCSYNFLEPYFPKQLDLVCQLFATCSCIYNVLKPYCSKQLNLVLYQFATCSCIYNLLKPCCSKQLDQRVYSSLSFVLFQPLVLYQPLSIQSSLFNDHFKLNKPILGACIIYNV